jgi:hypothetical protein
MRPASRRASRCDRAIGGWLEYAYRQAQQALPEAREEDQRQNTCAYIAPVDKNCVRP